MTVLWVCRFRQETDHRDKFMNNQTLPPCCSSHICSSDHFDTAGAEFQPVHMHLFVHFFAHYSFLPFDIIQQQIRRPKFAAMHLRTVIVRLLKLVEELK